jgi:hypothetical protein
MTLRPFKLIYAGKTYDRKNDIFGVENHRGERLDDHSNTNKGLGIKVTKKFWKKLLSYPITAFGYRIQFEGEQQFKDLPNPKFDKKDVIKALDFWIEYFVYQNKCDYILENTVNKDFELYLEELIRVREAVLKDPADTKYVRQKIRPDSGSSFEREYNLTYVGKDGKRIKHYPKQIIEFTENVLDTSNTPFSTVDQFCYKVKTMTRKEYEEYSKPKLYNKDLAQGMTVNLSRMIFGMIEANRMFSSEENFRDQRSRFEFGGLEDDQPSIRMWGGGRTVPEEPRRNIGINTHTGEVALGTEPRHPSLGGWPSSALAGKRISRVNVRLRRREGEEPTGSID